MTELWRCVVAVPLDDALRSALADAVDSWRREPPADGLRWTDPEGWHLTLAFLGPSDPARVASIEAVMDRAATAHAPMHLSTGGLGALPSAGRAHLLRYGVDEPAGDLAAMAWELRSALGVDLASPFRPHVTLARARREPVSLARWLTDALAPEGALVLDRLQLMRSHFGGRPARYEVVGSALMGGG